MYTNRQAQTGRTLVRVVCFRSSCAMYNSILLYLCFMYIFVVIIIITIYLAADVIFVVPIVSVFTLSILESESRRCLSSIF